MRFETAALTSGNRRNRSSQHRRESKLVMAAKRGKHSRFRRAHIHRGIHRTLEKPRTRNAASP